MERKSEVGRVIPGWFGRITQPVMAIVLGLSLLGTATETWSDPTSYGTGSTAGGVDAAAYGFNSAAGGDHSTASGSYSWASGTYGTATGSYSSASGTFSTATGLLSMATGFYSTATGGGSSAFGAYSTALGQGTWVDTSATNSVALGQGSMADQADTVSVGNNSTSYRRRIVNVADGIAAGDAATVGQLSTETTNRAAADTTLQSNISSEATARANADAAIQANFNSEAATRQSADNFLQAEVLNLQNRMGKIERRLDHVGALASAFSALVPNARSSANTQISLGAGYYGSSAAMAAGLFHYVNKNVLLNVGVSTAFNRHATAGRAGVTFGW